MGARPGPLVLCWLEGRSAWSHRTVAEGHRGSPGDGLESQSGSVTSLSNAGLAFLSFHPAGDQDRNSLRRGASEAGPASELAFPAAGPALSSCAQPPPLSQPLRERGATHNQRKSVGQWCCVSRSAFISSMQSACPSSWTPMAAGGDAARPRLCMPVLSRRAHLPCASRPEALCACKRPRDSGTIRTYCTSVLTNLRPAAPGRRGEGSPLLWPMKPSGSLHLLLYTSFLGHI